MPDGATAREMEQNARDTYFYVSQLSMLIRPVMATLLLSIAWVKLTSNVNNEYYDIANSAGTSTPSGVSVGTAFGASSNSSDNAMSLYIALGVIASLVLCKQLALDAR
jgi:hypothetical protein